MDQVEINELRIAYERTGKSRTVTTNDLVPMKTDQSGTAESHISLSATRLRTANLNPGTSSSYGRCSSSTASASAWATTLASCFLAPRLLCRRKARLQSRVCTR